MVDDARRETITQSATRLTGFAEDRTVIELDNDSGNSIFYGKSPLVSTVTGSILRNGVKLAFDYLSGEDPRLEMYAIANSTTTIVVREAYSPVSKAFFTGKNQNGGGR